MNKTFIPSKYENKLYKDWESKGLFTARANPPADGKKPFCIILPPPNANADLHMGHVMYVYEDIMIRYHKLQGYEVLWLPGADHAGFETQYVFEKELKKQGKNRFDYQRDELYKMIWNFVHKNRGNMENQLKHLGFALDWSRNTFTLDPKIVSIVYKTFKELYDDGLIYRGMRLVNYCTKDGTGFSDLEIVYVERNSPLYFMKYGPFTIATARPETKFRDTALAVNPKDKRYKDAIGKTFEIMGLLGPIKMTIIPDPHVDPEFGTGIMKVTPAHDPHDFELGQKFKLPITPIIDFQGLMDFSWFLSQKNIDPKYRKRAEKYHRKKTAIARQLMVEDLKKDRLLIKVDEKYTHRIGTCYKCGTVIEPLPLEQWYVRIEPLAKKAKEAIKKKEVVFTHKRFEKQAVDWLDNFHDWNISRQIVWGIRIPAYRCTNDELRMTNDEKWFVSVEKPEKCHICGECEFEQDTDTFDTWFSSGQWPFATLASNSEFFKYFYPTSVMETGYDILPWWVCRMLMLGIYATGKVPFKKVYLHGLVRDIKGHKMSKSKGNVANPLHMVEIYGADALRGSLVFEVGDGADLRFSEDKVRGMRNFANKIWNIGRFVYTNLPQDKNAKSKGQNYKKITREPVNPLIKQLNNEFNKVKKQYHASMKKDQYSKAFGLVYEFAWHRFADFYIEELKGELKNGNIYASKAFKEAYLGILILLHPFMPFVTDAIYHKFNKKYILENDELWENRPISLKN